MKVARKYIPLAVRVQVAERQMKAATGCDCTDEFGVPLSLTGASERKRLDAVLFHLSKGGTRKLELHHRPALCNRPWNKRKNDYDPPANSPDHLVYLADDDHDIETRVRGVGAQRSDLGQLRYNKKVARNREKRTGRVSVIHAKLRQPKRKWPSRKIPSRSLAT